MSRLDAIELTYSEHLHYIADNIETVSKGPNTLVELYTAVDVTLWLFVTSTLSRSRRY